MALDSNGSDELDAVLAVLDEALGVDSQLSLQSIASCDSRANRSSSATLKPKQTSRRNPRPEGFDPNKARRAMNREIQELRASAKVLTERLEAVRAVVADRDGKPIPGTCALGQNGSEEEKVWFELNQSQLAQRLEAAAENTRLKRAIEEATRIVHSFQEAATKSSRALSQRGVGASLPSKVHVLLLDSEEDTKMFEMMVKEVDASYDEAPEAFRVNNLVYTSDEPRFGVQMHEGNRGRFMDMFSETVLPFALEDTSRVVWEFYSGPAKHRGQVYFKTTKTINTSHETVVEKFAIEHHAMSMHRDFRIWQVLRRHIEQGRVLVVWITIALPVETSHKPMSNIGYCQKGYLQCEPLGQRVEERSIPYTRLRRCHRVRPYLPLGTERNLSEQDKREASVIMEWNVGLDTIHLHLEHFENQLLGESRRRPKQDKM